MNTIKAYDVKSLASVDVTNYKQGDLFITDRSVGILIDGKIKTLNFDTINLKPYVKKAEVEKMIKKAVKDNG